MEATGVQIDVSESRRAVNAISETERQVATLIDNLPGIPYQCKIDANWTMKFISKNALELTGYPAEDFLENKNLAYNDIIFSEDRELVGKNVQLAIGNNQPFQIESRIITRTGRIKWDCEQRRKVQVQSCNDHLLLSSQPSLDG